MADQVKLIRLSIGVAALVALSAVAAFLLRLNAHMSKSFWYNFPRVLTFVVISAVLVVLSVRQDAKTDEGRIDEILSRFPGPVAFNSAFSPD